jgi:hypothetical protein
MGRIDYTQEGIVVMPRATGFVLAGDGRLLRVGPCGVHGEELSAGDTGAEL